MMRKIISILSLLLLCLNGAVAQDTEAVDIETPVLKHSFVAEKLKEERGKMEANKKAFVWRTHEGNRLPEYEKLTYSVMWEFVSVGEATLELRGFDEIEGRKAHHIYSYAMSKPFFDEFFKVRDINEAWLDGESMSSLKFYSDISQGGWTKREQIDFDQVEKTYLLYDNGKMQKGSIPDYVQDVMTALYYVRTMDLKVGQDYTLEAHSGDLSWPLVVKVLRKEKKKTPAGEFNCIVVEPLVRKDAGIINAQGKMLVWITDDAKKIPVYLKSKIPVGSVNAVLEKIETPKPEDFPGKQ